MKNILAIVRKEMRLTFTTPTAYVVFSVFFILLSFIFLRLLMAFQERILYDAQKAPQALAFLNFTDGVLIPLFVNGVVLLIFVVPFLSMRLIAEERKSSTFELLMTLPVSPWQIVLGKYIASLLFLFLLTGSVVLYPALVSIVSDAGGVSWNTVFTGWIGLFLAGASFLAIGLFVSSLTESAFVAAAITFCALLMLWIVGWAGSNNRGATAEVLVALGAIEHIHGFSKGIIDTKDLVYYVSIIGFGLFMTQRSLETQRWR
jgi:ABC-2 type transport system permease protein